MIDPLKRAKKDYHNVMKIETLDLAMRTNIIFLTITLQLQIIYIFVLLLSETTNKVVIQNCRKI